MKWALVNAYISGLPLFQLLIKWSGVHLPTLYMHHTPSRWIGNLVGQGFYRSHIKRYWVKENPYLKEGVHWVTLIRVLGTYLLKLMR